jgi:hypothetical protein
LLAPVEDHNKQIYSFACSSWRPQQTNFNPFMRE